MRMWSLQKPLFILCFAVNCVTSGAELIHVSGYEGKEVHISCPYGDGYESYEKYLCKNDCGYNDVLIKTTEQKKNKYSIQDDTIQRVFTATIYHLMSSDGGKYWCGVTRNGKDIYTEVKLEVGQDRCCDRSTKIQSYEEDSVSFSCPYESNDQNSLKYMCRGNQPSTCLQQAIITSNNQPNKKFRLTDDKGSRKFTVSITSLTLQDSGSYLCGVQRTNLDDFSSVELEVKEWCCVKSNKLSGTVGDPLTIQCPYPPRHKNNRKFLCKGDHRKSCTDMMTSQSKFALKDDVSLSSFSVMITELAADDAGTYWCGSDSQWRSENYTKIQLSVVYPQQTTTVNSAITVEDSSQPTLITVKPIKDAGIVQLVVFIVPAVLFTLLLVLLFLLYKYKRHKVQATGVNNISKTKAAEAEEANDVADIYENQDVVACSKQGTYQMQNMYSDCDVAVEDQHDSVYQNCTSKDDIYCNQVFQR